MNRAMGIQTRLLLYAFKLKAQAPRQQGTAPLFGNS
ncbi:hypothetical protein M2366_001487 [Aeromonas sp. BIGb0405]|nr:hypothetical protein [Aeromonas sp. BIGb0405]